MLFLLCVSGGTGLVNQSRVGCGCGGTVWGWGMVVAVVENNRAGCVAGRQACNPLHHPKPLQLTVGGCVYILWRSRGARLDCDSKWKCLHKTPQKQAPPSDHINPTPQHPLLIVFN